MFLLEQGILAGTLICTSSLFQKYILVKLIYIYLLGQTDFIVHLFGNCYDIKN